jgi:hypothetical protein
MTRIYFSYRVLCSCTASSCTSRWSYQIQFWLSNECTRSKLSENALAAFAKKCQDVQKLHEHITSHLQSINNVPPPAIDDNLNAQGLSADQRRAQLVIGSYVTTLQNEKMIGTHHTHLQLIQ